MLDHLAGTTTPVRTVLVVDDNPHNRALAGATLEDAGYNVVFAEDGEAAIAVFERVQPQCILLDIQMPGIGGLAACQRIRELDGGVSVAILFVTAQHDVETFDLALAAGGDDFVTKPYRPSDLVVRMQTAVRLRRVAHENNKLCDLIKHQRDDLQRIQLQMCDANEQLVLATIKAAELADAADAARAEAARNEERFRTLVMTSCALLWRASADGRVQYDRATWTDFTGLGAGPGEWDLYEAVHPEDRERVRETWTRAVTSATPYECKHRLRTADGSYAWMLARAAPIPASGPVSEWVGILTDITDSVRIDEARDRFIGILGHDLRTPLGAILMGAGLLDDLSESQTDVVARITRSAQRMEAMIRDVLDFARGRLGGGIPVTSTTCNLGLVCTDVVAEIKQAYPGCVVTFESLGDLRGEWDPSRIEQVLSNVLSNAVQHGTGAIHMTSHADGPDVVTTVHNRGVPIPASRIATLFEPFSAEVHGVIEVRDGLGLGLYIASEITRAHGGSISVSSLHGEGTTFVIRLPRSPHPILRKTGAARERYAALDRTSAAAVPSGYWKT